MEFQRSSLRHKFHPSTYVVVLSIIVWAALVYVLFLVYSYLNQYTLLDQKAALNSECQDYTYLNNSFPNQVAADVRLKPDKKVANWAKYLKLRYNEPRKHPGKNAIPPFVTIVSSYYFPIIQGLLKQINEDIYHLYFGKAEVKLIVFDFGMNAFEKKVFQDGCRCTLRKIDSTQVPEHISDPKYHSFRSVLIQLVLAEYGSAIWVDPHTRLVAARLPEAIEVAKKNGYALWYYSYPVPAKNRRWVNQVDYEYEYIIQHTHRETLEYLRESRCRHQLSRIIDSRLMIFYRDDLVVRRLMRYWLSCVLHMDCVSPQNTLPLLCPWTRYSLYETCHRYEMSALSVVMTYLPKFDDRLSFQPISDGVPGRHFELEEYFAQNGSITIFTDNSIFYYCWFTFLIFVILVYIMRSTFISQLYVVLDSIITNVTKRK